MPVQGLKQCCSRQRFLKTAQIKVLKENPLSYNSFFTNTQKKTANDNIQFKQVASSIKVSKHNQLMHSRYAGGQRALFDCANLPVFVARQLFMLS